MSVQSSRKNKRRGNSTENLRAVEGNTVRKLRPVKTPDHESMKGPTPVPGRNHLKEKDTLSIPYCIFLAMACVLTLFLGANYLQQQATSTSSQKKIASLENQLADLKKENNDDLNRIETSVNLENIRDTAINELGMVYASEENVVLYENSSQDYVSQYQEVPKEEESLAKSILKKK